jgi:enoyl-CoA hydratase/carnithine racemase
MRNTSAVAAAGLDVTRNESIVRLSLNRPDRRNALSHDLIRALCDAVEKVAIDPSPRVVVIAAEGPVFSAGHDLTEMVGRDEEEYKALFADCSQFMQRLRTLPQPVIARVQGHAIAAGCQLVAACDLAVAAESATFSTPGVKIGLFCTTPMVPLVRAIAPKAALEMLLTGQPISAERAFALGLVNRVVPADQLDRAVDELCEAILATSPLTVRLGKAAFYDGLARNEVDAYSSANDVMVDNALRHDAQEGIMAFLEKRRAHWTGE